MPGQALALAVTAGVFALTVWRASRGEVTAGTVVLAVAALAQVREALSGVTQLLGIGSDHLNWFGKYQAFLSAEPKVRVPAHPLPLPARFDLALEDVSFSYPDGREALHRLTLHIPQGQMLAVVGENGAGKSTLARLLLRLYDPQQGRVTSRWAAMT